MNPIITHLIAVAVGAVVAGVPVWLIWKGRASTEFANGHAEGEVARTALDEQLKAEKEKVDSAGQLLAASNTANAELRAALDSARTERAQLAERANRLDELQKLERETADKVERVNAELKKAGERAAHLESTAAAKDKRVSELELSVRDLEEKLHRIEADANALSNANTKLQADLNHERSQAAEKIALITSAREELTNQFRVAASAILDEKSKKFTEQNETNLNQLLVPLKEKLTSFQAKVEEVYVNESKDRSALVEQVKALTMLNNTLSADTKNLTLALTGNSKAQGDYGELILDDVLERAGLKEGMHYQRQGAVKSEDGQSHVIPDVIINLPGDRHLVVDSKFNLPQYKIFSSAQSEAEKQAALKTFLAAVRKHVNGLAEKNYHSLYGLRSLDFVVMFIPLEPAFMVAVTNDANIFHDAWERNVLLVSPSTLLFVIRTVANLWRQEGLSRHARAISDRGAELYDKLVGFVHDLQDVGKSIQHAQDNFNEAKKKLSEGRGNVIRQAEMLRDLGVKPSKSFPAQFSGSSALDAPAEPSESSAALDAAAEPPKASAGMRSG